MVSSTGDLMPWAPADWFTSSTIRADLKVLERCAEVVADDRDDVALERLFVEVFALLAERDRRVCGVLAMPLADREDELQQLVLQRRRKMTDHAEVD